MERLALIGPPASGKGTQAEKIGEHLGLPVVSTGRMLRDEEASGSEVGLLSVELSKMGNLLPDTAIMELVEGWLAERGARFLFDGFPRTLPQGEAFEQLLADRYETSLDAVVLLSADEGELERRTLARLTCLSCGRALESSSLLVGREVERCPDCGADLVRRRDDKRGVFALRMKQYREMTEPLVAFYSRRGIIHRIDASGTPEAVFSQICQKLKHG